MQKATVVSVHIALL